MEHLHPTKTSHGLEGTGPHSPNGPAAALLLSAGIGSSVLGVAVLLASASKAVQGLLNWWGPAGPLVGKSTAAVMAWLASWLILHWIWRTKEIRLRPIWIASLALIAAGFLLTFPPVFEAVAAH